MINFADVKITLPDGHFGTMTVTLDGVDISHQVNAISFEATAEEPLVLLNLRLLAKVQLVGKVAHSDKLVKRYEPTTLEQASNNYDAAIADFMDAWEREEN